MNKRVDPADVRAIASTLPPPLARFQQAMFAAEPVNDDRWRCYVHHACECIKYLKMGLLDRDQTLDVFRDAATRYFDVEFDPQSKTSCQLVMLVIKRCVP